jgi:hypothetical protein
MSATNKATHLDIERISTGNNRKELVQTRITTARKTVFALMGAGLNGVNPKVAIHLIQIYVSMDCSSHGSFDINVTSSATVGVPQ